MFSKPIDLSPPWEAFPTYERYSLGWRMGPGQSYMIDWHEFIEALPSDYDTRLAYLRRHRPAPLNWCDELLAVLQPDRASDQKHGCSSAEIERVLKLQLVEHDAAYKTWQMKQVNIAWPWSMSVGGTPEEAARYGTREFWFFSRQLRAARLTESVDFGEIPDAWRSVEAQIQTGQLGDIDPRFGLLTLAQMLCADDVQPPWLLGITLSSFADSYEMDMAYCDAFRLWIVDSFDDKKTLSTSLKETSMPDEWRDWINEQVIID